jgi:hypothetical protein
MPASRPTSPWILGKSWAVRAAEGRVGGVKSRRGAGLMPDLGEVTPGIGAAWGLVEDDDGE